MEDYFVGYKHCKFQGGHESSFWVTNKNVKDSYNVNTKIFIFFLYIMFISVIVLYLHILGLGFVENEKIRHH